MTDIMEMMDKTWRIDDGMVRFFVLEGKDKALMIDSGMNCPNAKELARKFTDKPLELLNTHADRDHISGNGAFDKCYMNPAEEENYRAAGGKGEILPVRDGDIIDLGERPIEIIEIPGHTPGSIALLDINNRLLISGDSVQAGNIFMFGKFRNINNYITSLEKLRKYEARFDIVYPSHGPLPVKPELTQKLIEGAKEIVNGTAKGEEVDMFGNKVKLYKFDYAGFFGDMK